MSVSKTTPSTGQGSTGKAAAASRRTARRSRGPGTSVLSDGEPMVWLTGGALAMAVLMIVGLLGLVFWLGMTTFVAGPLLQVKLLDGTVYLGEVSETETVPLTAALVLGEPDPIRRAVIAGLIKECGSKSAWAPLAAEIGDQAAALDREAEEVTRRLSESRARLTSLSARRPPMPDSPAARVARIRSDGDAEQLNRLRQQVQLLSGRREALRQQAASDRASAASIAAMRSAAPPVEAILSAPADTGTAAVGALLAIRARQLGVQSLSVDRRQLRTENFDLTQTHYHWVADYEIQPDGESLPPWAMVVERTQSGRFYGFLRALVVRHRRSLQPDEQFAENVGMFLERNAGQISEPKLKKSLAAALARIRVERDRLRANGIKQFVAGFHATDGARAVAVTESGETFPLDKLPAGRRVNEIEETWVGPHTATWRFETLHAESRARQARQRTLEKNDLGRLNLAEEQARLQVREAEIKWSDQLGDSEDQRRQLIPVSDLVGRLVAQEQSVADFQRPAAEAQTLCGKLGARYGADSDEARAAAAIATSLAREGAKRAAGPASEILALRAQLATTPRYVQEAVRNYFTVRGSLAATSAAVRAQAADLAAENARFQLRMETADGAKKSLQLDEIVRAYPANQMSALGRAGVYLERWWEFLSDEPRDANSEGGVFPAIFGTVIMTLLMSLAVAPFGVLAALYLREYARAGPIVSVIRISINNLAGVPSIVFGVFGLGFFCYMVGAYIDGGPKQAQFSILPKRTWLLLSGLLAVLAIGAFATSLAGMAARRAEAGFWRRTVRRLAGLLWVLSTALLVYLLATTPLFHGLYRANQPAPTFGTGGLLWASLTLALLTLPVVIVATEEALSAVPNSMREGSYGCGASRWQTIRRIVLPHALPGILTGMILAMARGAGEVAPLMLVGAVHSAPALPVDAVFPYVHAQRSFMHLGYHIWFLGFQSPNSQASMPMVFTTALLLIAIVALLNVSAVWLRGRLRRRFQQGHF